MMKKTFYLSSVLCALLCNSNIVAQVGINTNAPEAMLHINGNLRVQNLEKDYPKEDLQQMMWDESTKELVPAQIKTTEFIYAKTFISSGDLRSEETRYNATSYRASDGHLFITNANIIPYYSDGSIDKDPNNWIGIQNMEIRGQEEHHPTWKRDNTSTYFSFVTRPAPGYPGNWELFGKVPSGIDAVVSRGTINPPFSTHNASAVWEFNVLGIRKEFIYVKNWYDTSYNNYTSPTNQQNSYDVTADSDGNASLPENPLANLPY